MVIALGIAASILNSCRIIRSYDRLEENSKKVITAAELQAWATNLLTLHPTDDFLRISQLGTNFPAQLLTLTSRRLGPHVYSYQGAGTNQPPHLRIYWGSGFLGASGFEIGPTNFDAGDGHAWAPGVYFYKR